MYRIFGCEGFVTDDSAYYLSSQIIEVRRVEKNFCPSLVIIEGLLRGFQDGQDIFTLSLGGADGWTESSSSVVASRLVDQGKVVTISAGNDVSAIDRYFTQFS